MAQFSGTIPLTEIERIQIYYKKVKNTKDGMKQILKETGGNIVMNAAFFLNTLKPCCHLKVDGDVKCTPNYKAWAITWNTPQDFRVALVPSGDANYMESRAIIVAGQKKDVSDIKASVAYATNRTAVGIKEGRFAYYVTEDNLTPTKLQTILYDAGWSDAIMMDGGGSSAIMFNGGSGFAGDERTIPFWLVITLKKQSQSTTKEETNMSKKVCLDAGHDAKNTNASPDKAYYEHEFALDMANRIGGILADHGVAVTYTRKNGNEVSLAKRCEIANAITNLDLFVSLHSNAGASSGWSDANGWEAHVYSTTGNGGKAATKIAERVKGVSKLRSTPVVANPKLTVLKNTKAPAVLIEHGFHTNKTDVANLNSAEFRAKLAQAEAYGILDYLGIKVKETAVAPAPSGGIDLTTLTDEQILYLAKRIREVESKQTNSVASELRQAFDSMI